MAIPAEAPPTPSSLTADLPGEVLKGLAAADTSADSTIDLDALLRVWKPYRFEAGPFVVETDRRWFSSLSTAGEAAPLLELRRWPGDSILALYAMAGKFSEVTQQPPPVPGGDFERLEQEGSRTVEWVGKVATPVGERPATWIDLPVAGEEGYYGALLYPGDAGLGPGATEEVLHELRAVLQRVEIRERAWKIQKKLGRAEPVISPRIAEKPDDGDEQAAPWQVVSGADFTIGLPPGIRARRLDGEVPPPVAIPGAQLWFRGRFVDMQEDWVAIGDGSRAGYVARLEAPEGWLDGNSAPLGALSARRLASQPFDLLRSRAGAKSGRVQRWQEDGFAGEWLVFRMIFDDFGVEIGLPMLAGRKSISTYWIPATWRGAGMAPAPPPVDPADRFGIRFSTLTRSQRRGQPWTEGILEVPGCRVELPVGWVPAASLRTRDGYPVRLILAATGESKGSVDRVEGDRLEALRSVEADWSAVSWKGNSRTVFMGRRKDGAHLFVHVDGFGLLFVPEGLNAEETTRWEGMMRSLQLRRPEPE